MSASLTTSRMLIEGLRSGAIEAGDAAQVAICDCALAGDNDAIADALATCRETEIESIDPVEWCRTANAGDYLARYWDGERNPGSRCGWSDYSLMNVRRRLGRKGLTLVADDTGLVVKTVKP